MLVVKNISEYGISVMTSDAAGQGRPNVLYLKPGKWQNMMQAQLKKWPHGAKMDMATCVQKGVLEVKPLTQVHVAEDQSSTPTFNSNNLASALTDAVVVRDNYNEHLANVAFHLIADTLNDSTIVAPTTLPLLIVFLTDLRAKFNLHLAAAGVHPSNDVKNTILAAVPTDLPTSLTVLREIFAKLAQHKEQGLLAGIALTPQTIINY